MYKEKKTFSGVDDVKNFSLLANKYEGTINLISDSRKINAKSVMSIFTLDFSKPIDVEVSGSFTDSLIRAIKRYKA